jgi:uncharacterized tellurite resistance protein B-like protein
VLVYADGHVNDHERTSGKWLAKTEGIRDDDFAVELEMLKSKDSNALLNDCIKALRKLDRSQQIRIIAWLCVVANGDGFMDKTEWQMIYRIYHKELHLPLDEIFKVQKEINRLPRERHSIDTFLKTLA